MALALLAAVAGCGGNKVDFQNLPNPDRYLFDRGDAALKEREWLKAREYFLQVRDNYPQSPLRPDAMLGIADTHLGEKSSESLVLAEKAGVVDTRYDAPPTSHASS